MCTIQLSGCNSNDSIISVSAAEFQKEMKADSVQILDVRTPGEYAGGHIDGAININIQSDDFQDVAYKELSKNSTILIYCRSGRRSLDAAGKLTELGYNVINLKGGIIEWEDCNLLVTTQEQPE
ncbi:MAG: rhodanese-like domain-containing protein [Muribaculaceae bacterium]|nr:rhodanese-like domain-containing protein [Muribaculaceae bacterium]